MKAQTLTFQAGTAGPERRPLLAGIRFVAFAGSLARWSLAGAVAITVLIGSIWAASTPSVDQYLAAGLWAAGFIFFALALDVGIRRILPYVFTGMTLPVLAVAGSELAAEFSMLAGAIIATWLAVWIVRRG